MQGRGLLRRVLFALSRAETSTDLRECKRISKKSKYGGYICYGDNRSWFTTSFDPQLRSLEQIRRKNIK